MEKVKLPAFELIGIKLDQKTTNKDGKSMLDCGGLWQKFEKENIFAQIPGKINDAVYAVYFDYEGGYTQPFSYFIGCKITPGNDIPKGMHHLSMPEQYYTKVTAKGKMPDCIAACWKKIWEANIKRAYKYDFEIYDERSHDPHHAIVDIFLSTE